MATASRRRRKTTPLDIFDRTDEARLSRSRTRELSKSDINRDLSEMEGTSKMRASTRKRKRLDREDEFLLEEEKQIESKKTRTAAKNGQKTTPVKKNKMTKDQILMVIAKSTLRVPIVRYEEKTPALDSSDEAESSSEIESGVVSSYNNSSSSSSSLSDRENDSPLPTSELSESSPDVDSSSYESSGNEDITWRIRKSPRQQAQRKSRKKISALFAHRRDSEESTTTSTSTESSYASDE